MWCALLMHRALLAIDRGDASVEELVVANASAASSAAFSSAAASFAALRIRCALAGVFSDDIFP